MHPNSKFQLTDRDEMAEIVRQVGFGMIVAQTPDGLRPAHVPVLVDGERVLFHLSRGNSLHDTLAGGCEGLIVVDGPHAYISPDWYGLEDRVPTWNYVAVELTGPVSPLDRDGLVDLVDRLSEAHERRLAPKPAWRKGKMTPGRYEGLLKAITGFELGIREWRGTAKIDQDKPPEVRARLAAALRGQGEEAMARLMDPQA
ncbi:MAG: transcriptional regulator [Sphingomonadales bacterium]|jgi:transcriptional regulator|nr:transcriptional regulator [Sphingomonadales bacterium]MEA3049741.1 transcriptional regulator [Sphingomonadales bacterium]